jgi:hypothetical protein
MPPEKSTSSAMPNGDYAFVRNASHREVLRRRQYAACQPSHRTRNHINKIAFHSIPTRCLSWEPMISRFAPRFCFRLRLTYANPPQPWRRLVVLQSFQVNGLVANCAFRS